jgi:hypothetical protein
MRRLLAITLLIAFGSPMAAPLFAAIADPEASLPPCCRSHGQHHCAMMHMMLAASTGPMFAAPPCPMYPAAATVPRLTTATPASALPPSVQFRHGTAMRSVVAWRVARNLTASANLKRGPPVGVA